MPTMNMRQRAFTRRVNYAHAAFLRGEDSREFDNCFEMYDGAFVVTALMRRAEADPALKAAIMASFVNGFASWDHIPWQRTAQKHARITDKNLSTAAAQMQIEAEWANVHVFIPQLQMVNDPEAQRFEIVRREGSAVMRETFYARNLREASNAVKSWHTRTVEGAPFLSLLAEINVISPDGHTHRI